MLSYLLCRFPLCFLFVAVGGHALQSFLCLFSLLALMHIDKKEGKHHKYYTSVAVRVIWCWLMAYSHIICWNNWVAFVTHFLRFCGNLEGSGKLDKCRDEISHEQDLKTQFWVLKLSWALLSDGCLNGSVCWGHDWLKGIFHLWRLAWGDHRYEKWNRPHFYFPGTCENVTGRFPELQSMAVSGHHIHHFFLHLVYVGLFSVLFINMGQGGPT